MDEKYVQLQDAYADLESAFVMLHDACQIFLDEEPNVSGKEATGLSFPDGWIEKFEFAKQVWDWWPRKLDHIAEFVEFLRFVVSFD